MVGDGDASLLWPNGTQSHNATRSPALSTDAIAHELTHMWIDARPPVGEAGSIHEGVCDVVGQFVEHQVAEVLGIPSRPDRLGESSFVEWNGLRYLAHPEVTQDDAPHSWSRECLVLDLRAGRPVLDSRGQPKLDLAMHLNPPKGINCDHHNATVVGHAFYLMTFGGKNDRSGLVIRNPIGWEVSQGLWLGMLVKVPTAQGLRTLVPQTLLDLAEAQLATARFHSTDTANAVGCAWEAVGVLSSGTTGKVTGRACTSAAPIECARRADGIYCDEIHTFSATRCQGGRIAASPPPCSTDKGQHCRPQGGFVTNPAQTDTPLTLHCYGQFE